MRNVTGNGFDYDAAPVAPRGSLGGVPLIDLNQPTATEHIAEACRHWGFFQVVGHGLSQSEIDGVQDRARAFFDLPAAEKRPLLRTRENPWGYYDRELTKQQRDRKEIFDIGPDAIGFAGDPADPFSGATPWPHQPPGFRETMTDWFRRSSALAASLVRTIGSTLSESGSIDQAFVGGHTSYLRLNHYPVGDPLGSEAAGPADLGIHHHTDAGALTVLLQDEVAGLQVFRDGQWHDVVPQRGALTINIGDMVQVWSNDRYRAPLHRVLAMVQSERLSLAVFYNPAYAADIAPLVGQPRYRPINWGEFRRRRAEGDFAAYGTEVQIADYRLPANC